MTNKEETFKPFFQKISDHLGNSLYERLSSPFFQSFILTWISYNWEILYYMFSSNPGGTLLERTKYIKENLTEIEDLLIYPVLISFAVLIGYVILSSFGFLIWEIFTQVKRWLRSVVIGLRPLDSEDEENYKKRIIRLDNQIEEMKSRYGSIRSDLAEEIENLKGELERKDRTIEKNLKEIKSKDEELQKFEIKGDYKEALQQSERKLLKSSEEQIRINEMYLALQEEHIKSLELLKHAEEEVQYYINEVNKLSEGKFIKKLKEEKPIKT